MGNRQLRIGRITFANLFPIFYALEKTVDLSAYEFIDGVPSFVNRLLREGTIDISPSSSIEYLRHENDYVLLDGHSISSFGSIGSILLFSKRPIENLDGLTVLTSYQSETSVALLDIILAKFYGFRCTLKSTSMPLSEAMESHTAYLLIGDDALREAKRRQRLSVYDLGDIWYRNTGLPFVFALWMARKDFCAEKPLLFEKFRNDLDAAKIRALESIGEIARESPLLTVVPEDDIVSYWQGISYDMGDDHKKGLELFRKYSEELRLI